MMILLANEPGSWALFFGRFHPLLVHLPIGILIVAFLLEALSKAKRLTMLAPAVLPLLIFGAFSAVISCIAGYLLSLAGGYDENVLSLHQWLGISVAVISLILCVLHRNNVARKWRFAISLLMIVALSAAGHYGGSLTHGDDYLTAALPGRKPAATNAIPNIEEARVYDQLVQPILEEKCYGCHNAQKLKGGLRLDGMEHIRKGGSDGPVIKDSIPEMSELYKRLILPENDDKRMPPKGKSPLTPQQLEILYWWIAQGAPDKALVKDLQKTPRIQLVLEAMQEGSSSGEHPFMPTTEVSAAAEKDIDALEKIGVKVMPVAKGSNFLMVSCVNAPEFSDKDVSLLLPLQQQLVWLKLTDTKITDSAMLIVAKLPQLTRLQLEYTAVTDEGLKALKANRQLKYLNLMGTKVKEIAVLRENKALGELFLYKTAASPAAIMQLQKMLPGIKIDTGGYRMPVLATDTTVFHKK